MSEYCVIGIMSGSSLDALDMVCACFYENEDSWKYEILDFKALDIPPSFSDRLSKSDTLSGRDLHLLDIKYGEWIGQSILDWLKGKDLNPDLISVHGHTVFHEPSENLSLQIGSGSMIANITKVKTIDTFRSADIIKGGQGAPLVPVGEKHLFSEFNGFVNLGGIANVSIHGNSILAWDIAPCNQVLNHFARQLGYNYDKNGESARKGSVDSAWLNRIEQLEYFQKQPPKSLSNQWTQNILDHSPTNPLDGLATYCEFLSDQITNQLEAHLQGGDQVLFTGGGTHNKFLMEKIIEKSAESITSIVPKKEINDSKEALIFAFLGLLRINNKTNILSSVTGASSDSSSGIVHLPA